ncbi:MAG: transcriptional repressor LexA [Fibrobacterota bacterium]
MEHVRDLTARQKQIFNFIVDYSKLHAKPPTLREIGEEFKIKSTNGVSSLLVALRKKGYLALSPRVSRGIQIIVPTDSPASEPGDIGISIPILGRVAAGGPILAVENIEGTVVVDASFCKRSRDVFALRVQGDSMVNAGIHHNDLVFVRQNAPVSKGDIVVAVIGSDATVKRYFPEHNRIRLEPENEAFGPIIVDEQSADFRIAGKVIGVLRKY